MVAMTEPAAAVRRYRRARRHTWLRRLFNRALIVPPRPRL